MRLQWFACLLLAGLAYAQTAPATPPAAPGTKPAEIAPAKTIAPEDTVLTIKGICSDPGKQATDCKTAISRAEFDKLVDTIQPNMPVALRRNLATQYSAALLMSAAAEKRGLDKGPKFEQMMRLARMQTLARELSRALQEESGRLTDAEYEDYYSKNIANFEEAECLRIFVPHDKQIANAKPDVKPEAIAEEQKAGKEEMKKFALSLHARAMQGEDFDKLEKEAFAAAGFKGNPPDTKTGKVRRTSLAPKHGVALDVKPGEVSELISDPSGYYIYKLLTKKTLPLESVKQEIRNTVSAQRYRDAMKTFQNADNEELNEAYFGAPPKPLSPPKASGKKDPEAEEDND